MKLSYSTMQDLLNKLKLRYNTHLLIRWWYVFHIKYEHSEVRELCCKVTYKISVFEKNICIYVYNKNVLKIMLQNVNHIYLKVVAS